VSVFAMSFIVSLLQSTREQPLPSFDCQGGRGHHAGGPSAKWHSVSKSSSS
jgi:hypothetical protein